MNGMPRIARGDLTVEPVHFSPYRSCYRFLLGDKTVAVLYWDDSMYADGAAPTGWTYFSAAAPQHHTVIGDGPSEDAAIAMTIDELIVALSRPGAAVVGLEDVPAERLPWTILAENEDGLGR